MEIKSTYYDRVMPEELVAHIKKKLPWIIDYVKEKTMLDFQTGNDPKTKRAWFSIYRGTGRIFTIELQNGKVKPYYAADSYMTLLPEVFKNPGTDLFDNYLKIINEKCQFERYYKDSKNVLKEGYFQTLIGRRYTFDLKPTDDFVIVDKELVIGFRDSNIKSDWNKDTKLDLEQKISKFRDSYSGKLPQDIKAEYGEFDFLALKSNGDILIMELKQNDPAKTALSPIQTAYYYQQFDKLLKEDSDLSSRIIQMVRQKMEIGIVSNIFSKKLPEKLSGNIIPCVIVGEDCRLSETICDRYEKARLIFLPQMEAFTCKEDGTLYLSEIMNRMETTYKKNQAERQTLLIESDSECYYGAKNRGFASWEKEGRLYQRESRAVLKDRDREKNLYQPIRRDVIEYMKEKQINWWHMVKEKDNKVTAHVLSSQVHCINHLFAIRNDAEAIKAILKNATGIEFDEILTSFINDCCLISFEFVFENKSLLNEEHETRGKKCTSIDALIYAKKGEEKWLVPVEWKYTEAYDHKKDAFNYSRYKDMPGKDSRLDSWHDLYKKEPFYELGRQTLLMEKIIENHPEIANRFFHLVVIPVGNEEMRMDAKEFQDSLTADGRDNYKIVSPEDLLSPIVEKYSELCEYLRTRYWE